MLHVKLLREDGFCDATFVDDLTNGFPGVGVLPETWHHTEPDANLLPVMEVEQLIAARQDSNESIVSSLTEYEHAEEMHKMTKDDADKRMDDPAQTNH